LVQRYDRLLVVLLLVILPVPVCGVGTIMKRILDFIGMSAGGWLGWTVGGWVSIFVAFVVGILGTAAGLWATRRFLSDHLP